MTVMHQRTTATEEPGEASTGSAFGSPGPAPTSAREVVNEIVNAGLLDEAMAKVATGELALTGAGGFLPKMLKAPLQPASRSSVLGLKNGSRRARRSAAVAARVPRTSS